MPSSSRTSEARTATQTGVPSPRRSRSSCPYSERPPATRSRQAARTSGSRSGSTTSATVQRIASSGVIRRIRHSAALTRSGRLASSPTPVSAIPTGEASNAVRKRRSASQLSVTSWIWQTT